MYYKMFKMRKTRVRRTISIIKPDYNYIFILIVKNEFYKIAFRYQSRKYIYFQHNLLFFAI